MNAVKQRLISVEELADLMSCTTRHVYNLSNRGNFPPVIKLGRISRFDLQDVNEYIQAKKDGVPYRKTRKSKPK